MVKRMKDFYEEVPRLVSELKLQLRRLQPLYGTLDEVFKRVVEKEGD